MCGYVYVFHAVGTTNYKAGLTLTGVEKRLSTLQVASAYPLRTVGCLKVAKPDKAECVLHTLLSGYRMHGEWFSIPDPMAIDLSPSSIEYPGYDIRDWLLRAMSLYASGQPGVTELGDARATVKEKDAKVKRKAGRPVDGYPLVTFNVSIGLHPIKHAHVISQLDAAPPGKKSATIVSLMEKGF